MQFFLLGIRTPVFNVIITLTTTLQSFSSIKHTGNKINEYFILFFSFLWQTFVKSTILRNRKYLLPSKRNFSRLSQDIDHLFGVFKNHYNIIYLKIISQIITWLLRHHWGKNRKWKLICIILIPVFIAIYNWFVTKQAF